MISNKLIGEKHPILNEDSHAAESTPTMVAEERKPTSHSETDKMNEKKFSGNGNLVRGFRGNGLPKLDKRGTSKNRPVNTPQHGKDMAEENTTTHMTTYTRATHKIPLPENVNKKLQTTSRNPHKSLPKFAGVPRKLEKIPKSKLTPFDVEVLPQKDQKYPLVKGEPIVATNKSNIFLRHSNKTVAGYSDGKTKTNQDTIYVNLNVKQSMNSAVFGTFDGHGLQGHKVSQNLKANLTGSLDLLRILRNEV